MKISKGITTGNIIQIVVMLLGLAVLWGETGKRVDYIEKEVNKKANVESVNIQFQHISEQLNELKSMLRNR